MKYPQPFRVSSLWTRRFLIVVLALSFTSFALAATPRIKAAKFEAGDSLLVTKVARTGKNALVTIADADSGQVLDERNANKKGQLEAKTTIASGDPVPCRVRVSTSGGSAEADVANAPPDCGDNSSGGDPTTEHENLSYTVPGMCLECHEKEAHEVFGSTHYQWKGDPTYMINQPDDTDPPPPQGKHAGAVNTYCGNILGNWNGCSACHVGLGAKPESESTPDQLANIDCLICHQEEYKRKREGETFVPDLANMKIDMDEAVQTVHKPTRVTCLQCHAKAGGGDAVKRGDLALASGTTADRRYDVHMAKSGADLSCQDCHVPQEHHFPGKGSDIRPTDLDQPVECASAGCHSASPHGEEDSDDYLERHTDRVACQTCHISVYAKDASDTDTTEATEVDRSWTSGTHNANPPYHPVTEKANDLVPVYLHWNRYSDNVLLGDTVSVIPGAGKLGTIGLVETSVPDGSVSDPQSKLYPFKYKTSDYPLRTESSELIALDTSVFFASNDMYAADAAALAGLENMDYDSPPPTLGDFEWVTTDTYQLLNHQVGPQEEALGCNSCHMSTTRMDLMGELGYAPTDKSYATCAGDCHSGEKASEWSFGDMEEFMAGHKKHREKGAACSECHAFNR